ncbi:MAG: hypothetical protein AAF657_05550 [Acidobacteriota bacterium]
MHPWNNHSTEIPGQDLTFLGDAQYVYHCHHFNLFHDQTVEDALGEEEAFAVRSRAAADAVRPLLTGLAARQGAETPAERLQLAAGLFPWMGHGSLELQADAAGGEARGEHLHYSFAWREKYGSRIRRRFPIDAFAAGFAAAATEMAFALPNGSLQATETECYVRRDPACRFQLRPQEAPSASNGGPPAIGRSTVAKRLAPPAGGRDEDTISSIARGLKDFVLGVEGDARGLVQGFGIYITRHLSTYYNATAFDTIHHVEQAAPAQAPVVEELFGESGHVCAFYTCGNILLSPEWEAMAGPVRGEVEEVVAGCVAICRALGFGHWTVEELVPDARLVMRGSSNYEAPFYLERYGQADKPRCYFFANAARAIMQLATQVDWAARPQLDEDLYQNLFKSGLGWTMEQTACLTRGDEYCEVVVTKT